MNNVTLAKKKTSYEPSCLMRLLLWLTIYLVPPEVGTTLSVLFFDHSPPDTNFDPLLTLFLAAILFPIGLFPFYPTLGYVFYLSHLICTLCVRNKNYFKVAMIIMVIAVTLNLVSCAVEQQQLSHFAP
jgi:hypothetical protein